MDTSAWKRAVQRSQGLLTQEDRVRYAKSLPHDIVQDFKNSQKMNAQTNKVEAALARIQPFVFVIERYGTSLDILTNAAPDILSPIWGTIRALLVIVKDAEGYFSRLIEMLEQIGHALPRFEVYEKLFRDHQNLQHALSDVYLDLVHFLSEAKRLFSRSSLRLVLRAFWKSFNKAFEDDLASLKINSGQVEKEAKVVHMIEEAETRLVIIQSISAVDVDHARHCCNQALVERTRV